MRNASFQPENFSSSMFSKNLEGIYLWVNRALLEKHKLKAQDIVGKNDHALPWNQHAKHLKENDEEVFEEKSPKIFKETASRFGTLVKGFCQKSPLFEKEGKLIGLSGVWIDAPLSHSFFKGLSIRERQCLEDIVSGKSSQESADRLSLSRRTIESYIESLKNKLNCKNKTDLIIKYYENMNF